MSFVSRGSDNWIVRRVWFLRREGDSAGSGRRPASSANELVDAGGDGPATTLAAPVRDVMRPVDLDAVRATLRAHGVTFALVFGGRVAGTARDGSGVDLAVWADRDLDEAFRRERFRQDFLRAHG
jgi:hypothetical protein